MDKFKALIKASFVGELNIFRIKSKKGNSVKNKFRNVILFFFLTLVLMFVAGQYEFLMADALKPFNLTYVMLSIFAIIAVVIVFIEGLYKSSGILFNAKDDDMLFSMPIPKKTILATRVIKLLYFEYVFELIILIPACIIYIFYEHPGVWFYIASFVMLIFLPVIPTILGAIGGYIIKVISMFFKAPKKMETVVSILFVLLIYWLCFSTENVMESIIQNATSINEIISKIYFPIGLYIDSILSFNILKLLIFIIINVVIFTLFIYIFSLMYFKVISKSKENHVGKKFIFRSNKIKVSNKLGALVCKELKCFFSIPVYVLNTGFGMIMLVLATVGLCANPEAILGGINSGEIEMEEIRFILEFLPIIFIGILMFTIAMSTMTSSSISLEGKSFNLLKSLPVDPKNEIFLSKILTSDLLIIPISLICSLFAIWRLKFSIYESILVLGVSIIFPNIIAISGLIINLKYPLLEAKNEAVVVKQSMAAMISTFLNIGYCLTFIGIYVLVSGFGEFVSSIIPIMCALILCIILIRILNTFGFKKFVELNS